MLLLPLLLKGLLFIYLWLCWVFVAASRVQLWRVGAPLGGCAQVSHCRDFLWLTMGSRSQAQQLWCTGLVLPGPGIEPVSPALAGRFSTTRPPGRPPQMLLKAFQLTFLCPFPFPKLLTLPIPEPLGNSADHVGFLLSFLCCLRLQLLYSLKSEATCSVLWLPICCCLFWVLGMTDMWVCFLSSRNLHCKGGDNKRNK